MHKPYPAGFTPPLPFPIASQRRRGLGLRLALASLACAAIAPAQAQQQSRQQYDIPAGPLMDALSRYAQESGVVLSLMADQVANLQSRGLHGSYGVDEGFAALLSGTGLDARRGESGYTLVARPALKGATELPAVTVTGSQLEGGADQAYRASSASIGVLGQRSLKDTPYSIDVITRDLLDNRQATSLTDALKGDASVSMLANDISGLASQVSVRGIGLDLVNGRKIDGLNVFSWSSELPLEHFESVQILKGATGFLYGFAQPGGVVNYVSKRPTAETRLALTTQVTDSGTVLLHGDAGGRFGGEDRFGYRVNLVDEQGDTYVDGGSIRRRSGSIALDWRITPDLVWSVDALRQDRKVKNRWLGPVSERERPDGRLCAGGRAGPHQGQQADLFAVHRLRNQERHHRHRPGLARRAQVGRQAGLPSVEDGPDLRERRALRQRAGRLHRGNVRRHRPLQDRRKPGPGHGGFATGPIEHEIALGASYGKTRGYTSSVSGYEVLGTGNIYHPPRFANPHLDAAPVDTQTSEVTQRSVFASDTLHLGQDWDLIAGLRRSNIKDRYAGYDSSAVSPTYALVFRPLSRLSLYGSYIESLEQGAIAPISAANAYQSFPPLKSRQVEVGAKLDGEDWSATAALFQIKRGLTYTDANNVFTQDGRSRYDGLELSGKARLSRQWVVNASALFLRSKVTQGVADLIGNRIDGVPRQQFAAYAEYTIPDTQWTLTAGGQYYGSRFVDAGNTVSLPSYTLFDAGARYVTRLGATRVTVRLNVDNLANKAYWMTSAGTLLQGMPRVAKLSAQFEY
ncbi:TonB-dependent receptor [Achromobacter insuavis]